MKIAIIIVRILVGLLFLFASITYFLNLILNLMPQPEMTGKAGIFMEGLAASGYILPIVKALELLCGLAFVSGRFAALAVVVIFPIAVNILLVHALLLPDGLTVAIPLFLGILFLAYAYRTNYAPLFAAK